MHQRRAGEVSSVFSIQLHLINLFRIQPFPFHDLRCCICNSEYSKLMAGMEFDFRGEKLPRPALLGYLKDSDRTTRREAMECLGTTLEKNSAELDRIFDALVHVRDRMAKKIGRASCRERV